MINVTETRTHTVLNALADHPYNAEMCSEYGEPSYSNEDVSGVITCDWNAVSERIMDYLEAAGFAIEWCDEWYIDTNNDKAWRTSPDGYAWRPQLAYGDGYVLTPDDDDDEWINLHCDETPQLVRTLPGRIDDEALIACGFVHHSDVDKGVSGVANADVYAMNEIDTDPNVRATCYVTREEVSPHNSHMVSLWYKPDDDD